MQLKEDCWEIYKDFKKTLDIKVDPQIYLN